MRSQSDSPRGSTRGALEMKFLGKRSQLPAGRGVYVGEQDLKQRPHGRGRVEHTLSTTTQTTTSSHGGKNEATPTLTSTPQVMAVVEGQWVHGQLEGAARFSMNGRVVYEGLWTQGWIAMQSAVDEEGAPAGGGDKSSEEGSAVISSLSMADMECMWAHCSDCCDPAIPATAADYGGQNGESDKSGSNGSRGRIPPLLVHYPGGPTDLSSFVHLVSVWFLCGTIFVLIMGY